MPVPVAVVGFAGSPLTLVGEEIEKAGGMAAGGWGPLAEAVKGSKEARMGLQIGAFEVGTEVHLEGGQGEEGFGFEEGMVFGEEEEHLGQGEKGAVVQELEEVLVVPGAGEQAEAQEQMSQAQ